MTSTVLDGLPQWNPEHATRAAIVRIDLIARAGTLNERACDGFDTTGPRFGPQAAVKLISGGPVLWPKCDRCKAALLEALAERAKGLIHGRIKPE